MKIKATAVASRGSDNVFRLSITDKSSHIQFAVLCMSPEEFALVLTAHVVSDLECEVCGLDGVGKVRETKTVRVPFQALYSGTDEERARAAKQAMEPFEVDGWKGRMSDMLNWHRTDRSADGQAQYVIFERLVGAKDGAP